MAGITIDINNVFKKYAFKPEYDSDGGGDYVDGVDDLQAAKFNHRFNGEDEILDDLQYNNELLQSLVKTSFGIGFLYEDPSSAFASKFELPFALEKSNSSLEFKIAGTPSVLFVPEEGKLVMPTTQFYDLIKKGDEQFSIVSGNTNLFEIQNDKPTSAKRWYRLGHDGAEGSPAAVTVRKIITAEWGNGDVKFHDYMNNPSGGTQVIRFDSVGRNGEYIEIIMDDDYPNYRWSAGLWNGSLQTYVNQDSGVARADADFNVSLICNKEYTSLNIGSGLAFYKPNETMQFIDELEFTSNNATGSADYFDILRYNLYFNVYLTALIGHNYVYFNRANDYDLMRTLTSDVEGVNIYTIDLHTGATGILDDNVTDTRLLGRFTANINLNATYIKVTDLQVSNMNNGGGFIISDDTIMLEFGKQIYLRANATEPTSIHIEYEDCGIGDTTGIEMQMDNVNGQLKMMSKILTEIIANGVGSEISKVSIYTNKNGVSVETLDIRAEKFLYKSPSGIPAILEVNATAGTADPAAIVIDADDNPSLIFREGGSGRASIVYDDGSNFLKISTDIADEPIKLAVQGNDIVLIESTGLKMNGAKTITFGIFTDSTRGAAGTAGRVIFNTDDGNLNIDDGTNWILPDGTTT